MCSIFRSQNDSSRQQRSVGCCQQSCWNLSKIWFGCVRSNKMKSSLSLSSALHSLDGTKDYIQRLKTSSNIIERNSKHEIWRRLNGYAFVITIREPLDLVMSASRLHLIVDVTLGKESDDIYRVNVSHSKSDAIYSINLLIKMNFNYDCALLFQSVVGIHRHWMNRMWSQRL
jgi:hypothetical protein